MKNLFTFLSFCLIQIAYGQTSKVDVADLTLKIGGVSREVLYYGFAEGDQIIFSFEEINGKPLKEIEIMEMPNSSKFADFKTTKITDKIIQVHQTGVYGFGFRNSAMTGRICKIKIQRIPKSEDLIAFNTNWEWKTLYDTSYVPYTEDSLVGRDTTYVPYTKRELARVDTLYQEVMSAENKTWVYSGGNIKACLGKSASCTKQKLVLQYPPMTDALLIWVGIGQETRAAYNKLSASVANVAVKGGAAFLSGGSSLLASSFSNSVLESKIENLPTSKNVLDIFLTSKSNADLWYNSHGTNLYSYAYENLAYKDRVNLKLTLQKKLGQIPPNTMTLCLKNNSKLVGVEVYINIISIVYQKVYENNIYQKMKIKPIYVTLNKQRMLVKRSKIRVNSI